MDQWIYFLKNEVIKDSFEAKGIKEAKLKLDIMKMTEEERRKYEAFSMQLHDDASWNLTFVKVPIMESFDKGVKEGIEQGIKIEEEKSKQKVILMVIEMKKQNLPTEQISAITGLSIEEIDSIKERN